MSKLIVIALGGNAIKQAEEKGTAEEQLKNIAVTCEQLIKLHEKGYKLVITHGNGPQAGNLLIQQEEAKSLVPAQPLDIVGAMTQGQIGYMFQRTLANYFNNVGKNDITVASIVTQVLVSENDPDFKDPTKPVGPFYSKEEALKLKEEKGYVVKEVKPGVSKSWRRVVASPEPLDIVEKKAVNSLIKSGVIVITSGGGGVPVMKKANGEFLGLEAVIDKDRAGNILAQDVNADAFIILTDVENAMINFGKPNQKAVGKVNIEEIEALTKEGHFLGGSMGPKVEAATKFAKTTGKTAIITSLDKVVDALEGKTGTIITK